MNRSMLTLWLATLFVAFAAPVRAQESAAPPAVAELPPLSEAEASDLLRGLSSADFAERRDATQALVRAGTRAIDVVAKAAETSELETATRCLDVLKRLLNSTDAGTKAAAEAALKKLSEGDNRSIAQRAADAIRKPDPVATRVGVFGGPIQIQVGGIQVQGIQAVPAAPAGFRLEMTREATVVENGRTIRLRETAGKDRRISAEITETVDGKPKTTKIDAANVTELKRKSPESFQLYLKHLVAKAYVNRLVPAAGAVPGVVPGAIPNIRRVAPILPAPPVVPGAAGRRFSMKMQVVNGQRTIEVDDGSKKVEISDLNGKEITVKVTETVDGREKTTETKAADLDDLKKKNPDAAKLYEQHGQGGGGKIQINGGAGGGGGIQIQVEAQIDAGPIQAVPAGAVPIQAVPIQAIPVPAIPEAREDAPAQKP